MTTDDFIAGLLAELPAGDIACVEIDENGTVCISGYCSDAPNVHWSRLYEQPDAPVYDEISAYWG